MNGLLRDLGLAVRTLFRTPGFTLAAVLCLALGVGVNAALFSVVEGVLMKPLPYDRADRLVMVWNEMLQRDLPKLWHSDAELLDYREQSTSFESLAAYFHPININLTGTEEPERLQAGLVTADFFSTLGVQAADGRIFRPGEDAPGGETVAVISHRLGERLFGGEAVGETMTLNDESYRVVGVMPPDFRFFPADVELWVPLTIDPENLENRRYRYLFLVGRLEDGASLESAGAEMATIGQRFQDEYPEAYPEDSGWGVKVLALREEVTGEVRPALLMLSGAVFLVLLIACVNVANLLLARATVRRREVAVRTALGAGRKTLMRQFLVEGVVLSALGGALGIALAYALLRMLQRMAPAELPRLHEVGLDLGALAFVLLVSVVIAGFFALVPALRGRRAGLQSSLKDGGRSAGGGTGQRRALAALVTVEVALAMALLVGAGLMIRSFVEVRGVDPGFDAASSLTFKVALPRSSYPDTPQQLAFFRQLEGRLERLPPVESAGAVSQLPLSGSDFMGRYRVEGASPETEDGEPIADWRPVVGSYFEAMDIEILAGEGLGRYQHTEAPRVVVVDESLAERHWPGENPVGKRLWLSGLAEDDPPRRIVGVVRQVRHGALDEEPREQIYMPFHQLSRASMFFVVRASGEPADLVPLIRSQIRALDRNLPISAVAPMTDVLGESLASRRFSTALFGLFAAVALLLAVLGIYGVMAYTVAQRTQELGLRLALGAQRRNVFSDVLVRGGRLVLVGTVLGWGLAYAGTRFMTSLLYGVQPEDPVMFAGVAVVLAAVATIAMVLPARRATAVDPIIALRNS